MLRDERCNLMNWHKETNIEPCLKHEKKVKYTTAGLESSSRDKYLRVLLLHLDETSSLTTHCSAPQLSFVLTDGDRIRLVPVRCTGYR